MVGLLRALPVGPTVATTMFEEGINGRPLGGYCRLVWQGPPLSFEDYVDGGSPGGHCRWVWQRPPPRLQMTSMVGLLGGVVGGSDSATTEFEDDVDGGPPGGRYWWFWQCPPPSLKMTSMVGPMGGAVGGFGSVHHRVLKTTGLDPILCPNILQNRAWKVVIILVGLIP
jgi:hypothetical protein